MSAGLGNADLRRKIKVRMRPDLIINRQRYGGQTYCVVKDPVSLRYYRFRDEELFLLQQFDGEKNLDDVRHEFVEKFRPQRISVTELEAFVRQVLQAGIATVDTPQLGQRLYERYKKRRWDKIKHLFFNIFYLKVPLFDPERILTGMLPYFGFVFTIPFLLLMIVLWSSSALLVLVNWDTFVSKLPSYQDFFTFRVLICFWVTLSLVKVIHEFGHGLSCKKFGGEVHEMGFLFLILTPCLYCNVTDAWMLPNKWHRAVIGAAGIYVELILSSIFVWIWWYTDPGLLNTLSLSVIFICSVSTVLFNANPLMRFDGYYILSDLMEVPNLRERSNKYIGNVCGRFFFGSEIMADPYAPKRGKWFFAFYAVAAYVYRWVVVVGILWFLYTFLKPYKLSIISTILALGAVFTMFIMPVWQGLRQLRNRWREMKVNKRRMGWNMALTLLVLVAVMIIPLPMRVDAPMIVQPRDATAVFVQVPGNLESISVKDGEHVVAGVQLARMHNPELRKRLGQARLQRDQYHSAGVAASLRNDIDNTLASQINSRAAQTLIDNLLAQDAMLSLNAPRAGTVILPPKERELGKFFQQGQPFCWLGDPKDLEAYIVVEHSEMALIQQNQRVWLKVSGHVGEIRVGEITRVSTDELEELPQALSNKMGGDVATVTDSTHKIEKPQFKSYSLQVPLENTDGKLVAGMRGRARIDVGYKPLYWRLLRYLQQTFHFRM